MWARCLFVHADYQGRGVGTTLMETLLDLADHWLMLVRVELEVFADNEQAIRLYEKLGFREVGRRKNYYRAEHEDALLMTVEFDRHG